MPSSNDLPIPSDGTTQPHKPSNPSADLIRKKVADLYSEEPSFKEEEQEIKASGAHSKHQLYLQQLMNSGKSLIEINAAWHNYYQTLSDEDKKQVWREFYDNNIRNSKYLTNKKTKKPEKPIETPKFEQPADKVEYKPSTKVIANFETDNTKKSAKPQTVANVKKHILSTVSARGKLKKSHHIQSLLFGLSMGLLVVFILLFGFFNERIIAPFIAPSKAITSTPIIINTTADNAVSPAPVIIIPKINVEVPVVYDVPSINEKEVLAGLDRGVVHYPTTPKPGEIGNVVIVGHSANNLFNRGKYKYVFSLLNRLQEGDTFMLHYYGQRYVYKVYTKKIVKPTEVGVLGPADKPSTATLITCDPPGTALNRLVVIGEQISPAPANNIASDTNQLVASQPAIVPGNSESLFHRLFSWIWD